MSNIIKFSNYSFSVPGNGIELSDTDLKITFVLSEDITVEEIENMINGNTESVNLYDDAGENVVATYKGYSKFRSIQKINDYALEDGTIGTAIKVELYTPSMQDAIDQNTADISAINEAIADLATALGGE